MIIKNPELYWQKGEKGYKQGVKGRKNYRHLADDGFYNGYGGVRYNKKMELTITGRDEKNNIKVVDVRYYLVQALGRQVMRDDLFADLKSCMPESLEVDEVWGDRIFEKCGIRREEEGDGGKTLEIRGKRRLPARDGGANYQQS